MVNSGINIESKINILLDKALSNPHRRRYGFNVLFAGLDKAPRIPWEKWQREAQSDEDVRAYFIALGADNVSCWGFVCGYKGLVTIDFDWGWVYRLWRKNFDARAETLTLQTPNSGFRPHYICQNPETIDRFKESLHVELKGPGRFVVFEGKAKRDNGIISEYKVFLDEPIREDNSIVTDTLKWLEEIYNRYHFLRWNCIRQYFSKKVLGEPPHDIRLFVSNLMIHEHFSDEEIHNLFSDFTDYKHEETERQIRYTRERVEKTGLRPPTCKTLREKLGWNAESCSSCERKRNQKHDQKVKSRDKETKVDEVIEIAREGIVELLYDRSSGSFAVVRGSSHQEIHAIRSRQFEKWLRGQYYKTERRGLRKEVVSDAVATLEAMAEFGDKRKEAMLYNRVAVHEGSIYYDLANSEWQAIKITPEDWMLVDNPPPLFTRFQHQEPQVLPEKGGNLDELFALINVKDEDSKIVIKCLLTVALVYGIPHPVLVLLGPQGCGKTLMMRILRMLIDPSRIPLLSFNYDRHETALMLHQHYAPFFDNVSTVPDWLSDILCRACTGDGFTKRQLYTDQDAVILEFRRCLGINGIDVTPEKPDLIDRAIILRLAPISPEDRRQETQIMEEFNKKRPRIFGAMLDALSKAMRILPTFDIKSLPRMADFAKWGEAVARALGYEPNRFIKAYEKILGEQTLAVLEVNPVGLAIIKLMERRESWQGKPKELLEGLEIVAEEHNIDTRSKKWPKNATWLTRRMREIENNLRGMGIAVDFGLSGDRVINIKRSTQNVAGNTADTAGIDQTVNVGDEETDSGGDKTSGKKDTAGKKLYLGPSRGGSGGKGGKGGISTTNDTAPPDRREPVWPSSREQTNLCSEQGDAGSTQKGGGNTADTALTATQKESTHSEEESLRFGAGDIVDELRVLWKRGSDKELEDLIVGRFGWLRERASALRERLIREGALVRDQQNLLVWRDERIASETPYKPSGPEPASEDPLVGLEEFYTPYDEVPGLMRCKICGSRFVRSRRDLEGHLDYHRARGELGKGAGQGYKGDEGRP